MDLPDHFTKWNPGFPLQSGTDGTIANLCFHSPLSIRIAGSFQGHAYLAVRVENQMIQENSYGEDEGIILSSLPILYLIIQGTLTSKKDVPFNYALCIFLVLLQCVHML